MGEAVSILLVPPEHDPYGLLWTGPCGTRPPMAWRGEISSRWLASIEQWDPSHALVLAWESRFLPEGVARAERSRRVIPEAARPTEDMAEAVSLGLQDWRSPIDPTRPRNDLKRAPVEKACAGLGVIVLLGRDGAEVSDDREVEP